MTLVRRGTRDNPDVTIRPVPKTGHYLEIMDVESDGQVSNDYLTQLLHRLRRRAWVSQ